MISDRPCSNCRHSAEDHRSIDFTTDTFPCSMSSCGCVDYSYKAPEPKRPRIRITSDGTSGKGGTKVEVITQHGAVVDISNMVIEASWSLDGRVKVANIQLTLAPDAQVELLGDLTDVVIEDI